MHNEKPMDHDRPPEYETPTILDYGELTKLTAGNASGAVTDAAFPAHTPFSQLTFS